MNNVVFFFFNMADKEDVCGTNLSNLWSGFSFAYIAKYMGPVLEVNANLKTQEKKKSRRTTSERRDKYNTSIPGISA